MEETVNQDVTTNEAKTFTQEEVDAIIDKRYARLMDKYGDYEELKAKALKFEEMEKASEESRSELQKANERAKALEAELEGIKKAESIRLIKETVSSKTGVPISLLTGETEEDCKAQAEQILEFANMDGYPALKDGGEPQKLSKLSTAKQFEEWVNQNHK